MVVVVGGVLAMPARDTALEECWSIGQAGRVGGGGSDCGMALSWCSVVDGPGEIGWQRRRCWSCAELRG